MRLVGPVGQHPDFGHVKQQLGGVMEDFCGDAAPRVGGLRGAVGAAPHGKGVA